MLTQWHCSNLSSFTFIYSAALHLLTQQHYTHLCGSIVHNNYHTAGLTD